MTTTIPVKRGGRRAYQKIQVANPGKGWNTLISENLIDDRESPDLENIQFVESGAPAKAFGYEVVGTGLTNNPRGLGYYVDTSGDKFTLTVDGDDLMYLNGSTWTAIAGANFDTSSDITFNQAKGKLYIWDGVSGGCDFDGSTLARPGTMPKAKFSIYYQGYHICSGVDGQPNRIYIANSSDTSDFTNGATTLHDSTEVPGATVFSGTGAQYVDINKDDGDKVTGLAKFQDALIIFKERAIFQMTFDSSGVPVVAAVTKSYGCVSHRSIDNVENDVFFLSRNGVYVLGNEPNYFNVIRTNELTARVHPEIETINELYFSKASGIFTGYTYLLGIPAGGTTVNNETLMYDRRFLAWSKWTHVQPESFVSIIDSNNEEAVYFTSASTNKVYKMNTNYSADGSAYTAYWTSKYFDLGDFASYKRWIDSTLLFRQLIGGISITFYTDNGEVAKSATITSSSTGGMGTYMLGEELIGGNQESTASVTTSSRNIPYRIRLSKKARGIKIRVESSGNNQTFVLLGFELTYRQYSHFSWPSALKIQ